jgi:hypothetical protein
VIAQMTKENRYAEWLGFRARPDIENAKTLGRVLGWILKLLILVSAVFFLGFLIRMGMAILSSDASNPPDEAIRNIGLAMAAIVGLPFLVWRSIVAQQQVQVAEQGQITDRINKAVEGLGAVRVTKSHTVREVEKPVVTKQYGEATRDFPTMASAAIRDAVGPKPETSSKEETSLEERTEPNIEVRLGAIYSLERIAQDSRRDHISIMEILCAYIRENTSYSEYTPSTDIPETQPRSDIQAAISVLARRKSWQISLEAEQKFRLDLSFSNLTGIDFKKGHYAGAIFTRSILERADFDQCSLIGTDFSQTILNYSSFTRVNLRGAKWWQVTFTKSSAAPLLDAFIQGLDISGANISSIDLLHTTKRLPSAKNNDDRLTFGDADTKLMADVDLSGLRKETIANLISTSHEAMRRKLGQQELKSSLEQIKVSPFRLWSQYGFLDVFTATRRHDFREALNLTGWPYDDD